MKKQKTLFLPWLRTIIFLMSAWSLQSVAEDNPRDPNRLGGSGDLTPLGGTVSGNSDGTIPAWTGGITTPPAGYQEGGNYVNPYESDEVLFTIDASNMDQYRDKLSAGHIRMLKLYPTFEIPVYTTRRSASAPQYIYDATKSLVNTAALEEGGNGIVNAVKGIPFPIPSKGIEVIWNHIVRYRGQTINIVAGDAVVGPSGNYNVIKRHLRTRMLYSLPDMTVEDLGTKMLLYKSKTLNGTSAGEIILIHETINQTRDPRSGWIYVPGQRRVRRAPNIAYDYLGSTTGGLRTSDQFDMYNGAPDRYDWKLVGKKEMYVPYNSYKLDDSNSIKESLLTPRHLDPNHLRYELHRVWVVEAVRKQGASHIYKRRVFYIDEDSWNILLVDIYDNQDTLWRVQEAHLMNHYDAMVTMPALEVYLDLKSQFYLALGIRSSSPTYNSDIPKRDFTPAALRREGRR